MNDRLDLAIYVINLKIANTIKNNKTNNYNVFKDTLTKLIQEKEELYKNNEEVIRKVLDIYLEELKNK